MNSDHPNLSSLDGLSKGGIKMLVTIVNRADGDKTTKFLRERHFHFQFTCMAEGTQGSDILDMLGLDSVDKTVVFCISPGIHINEVLPELIEKLNLKKAGKGIAFTIPLVGFSIPAISPEKQAHLEQWQSNIETEVDKMNDNITHSIILTLINHGHSEELVKAAKAAGATGGTVINARHTGAEDAVKFFGLSVQAEKEMVAILTKRGEKQAIINVINKSFGLNSPARGIVLSLPVDGVFGMESK